MECIDEFEQLGKIIDESYITCDYKSGNRAMKKLGGIFEKAKISDDQESFYVKVFKKTASLNGLINCCADMMQLNIKSDMARKKLEEIAMSNKIDPLIAFSAGMFLEEWDKGNIKTEQYAYNEANSQAIIKEELQWEHGDINYMMMILRVTFVKPTSLI